MGWSQRDGIRMRPRHRSAERNFRGDTRTYRRPLQRLRDVDFLNATKIRVVKEMTFTAKPISAERAERLAIINYVVAADEIEAFTLNVAQGITTNASLSIAVMKEQLRILADAEGMSLDVFERVQGLRRICYDSHDYEEGIRAVKEKRSPLFHGD
jgi:methylmalonyl-CoA decarboxylase